MRESPCPMSHKQLSKDPENSSVLLIISVFFPVVKKEMEKTSFGLIVFCLFLIFAAFI